MPATKVTLLFNAGTVDADGNAARSAGFSESYYTLLASGNSLLTDNWNALMIARAALMPQNVRICGSRFQTVDPVGASKSFDNTFSGGVNAGNDLPQLSLQWTIRSPNTPNQRSLILRGMPDSRVQLGEYVPTAGFSAALVNFFNELKVKWRFRAIDRTILPIKITTIVGGLMTTLQPHFLAIGDKVNVMSTIVDAAASKKSYEAFVGLVPTAFTAQLFLPGRGDLIPVSHGGRFRKAVIFYPNISIEDEEIITPTAITRKAGRPFRQFHGRRSSRRL